MAFRLYLIPIIGAGVKGDARRPKYLGDGTIASPWSGMDYGLDRWMVVGADLSVADDSTLAGQPDVLALPVNLALQLTAPQVTTMQAALEAINLPAGWVDTTFTWQQVVRIVLGVLSFMQRFAALSGASLFPTGVTLATTVGGLAVSARTNLLQAAMELGLDTSGVTGSSTLRQVLKNVGTQLQARPYTIGGVQI